MGRKLIVSAVGWSGSGKTSFLERAVAECARRGIPCSAAKATRHAGDFEPEGKDSARYRAAGAGEVAFVGLARGPEGPAGLTVLFEPTPSEPDRAFLERLFPGSPLVFAEGLVVEGALRLLVAGPAPGEEGLKRPLDWADILVTADPALAALAKGLGKAVVRPDAAATFVDMLEELMERDVTVTSGGKAVPLNPFVKEIVANTVAALVGCLKKADADEEIVVTIKPASK
ncbi:MAG TPA: molybdopterin-guanine dinucleotide biosynthesis protein MobB [Spirochaetales bacterium]|nr:molybdopterin-guanine dinucleotide biosynthesis protein MobB [Spirochaetales bacterium]